MCNCFSHPHTSTYRFSFTLPKFNHKTLLIRNLQLENNRIQFSSHCSRATTNPVRSHGWGMERLGCTQTLPLLWKVKRLFSTDPRLKNCSRARKPRKNIPNSRSSDGYEFSDDLWLKDKEKSEIPLSAVSRKDINDEDDDIGVGFLEFKDKKGVEEKELMKNGVEAVGVDSELELGNGIVRRGKQMMKRSNMIAKHVISVQSALSFGFVSQLWVDINSWIVFLIEVRPNLLSGEVEKFLLEDVKQVGDVVLVEDESVMENEFKLVGLQTLVGYNVVTPDQRNIGKVRGYTFNINSGAVEYLELDSLGISIIPSSLVSTYCLFVEDVVDVLSDTIIVQEAAASRLQRLTKGLWDAQKMDYSADEMEEYSDLRTRAKPEYGRSRKRSSGKKLRKKIKEIADDWELPMDFF